MFQVTCITTEGSTTSNDSTPYRSGPGIPTGGPTVQASAVNHTAVSVSWSPPPLQELKGSVQSYEVTYEVVGSSGLYRHGTVGPSVTNVVVSNLRPSTSYAFRVRMFLYVSFHSSSWKLFRDWNIYFPTFWFSLHFLDVPEAVWFFFFVKVLSILTR